MLHTSSTYEGLVCQLRSMADLPSYTNQLLKERKVMSKSKISITPRLLGASAVVVAFAAAVAASYKSISEEEWKKFSHGFSWRPFAMLLGYLVFAAIVLYYILKDAKKTTTAEKAILAVVCIVGTLIFTNVGKGEGWLDTGRMTLSALIALAVGGLIAVLSGRLLYGCWPWKEVPKGPSPSIFS